MSEPDKSVIWRGSVDGGQFEVSVTRTGESTGTLLILTATGEVLLTESVGLMYGAQFGPDVDDVAEWRERAIEIIDAWKERHGGPTA